MKTISRILAFCFLAVMAFSCKKSFLERAPISNANAENFFKTKADFDLAVNAAYNSLYTTYHPEGPVSYVSEQMSDNAIVYNISGIEADKWAFKDYALRPNNTMLYQFWQECYKGLYNINVVLSKIDGAEVEAAYKEGVKAELMFLRGLQYFNLVRIWGDVPVVLTPLTGEESYAVSRSTQADVYAQIIKDVQFAAEKLPLQSKITVKGKASKGAAQTLLGKIYITMGDKAKAATVLTEVVNSKEYDLLPTYAALWGGNVKNTKESIFEIQHIGGNPANPYSRYHQGFFPNTNIFQFYGGGMNQVTDDLWNEYETGDVRQDISISKGYQNGNVFVAQKFPKKWLDANAVVQGGTAYASNNFMVLRYADALLMLAEATGNAASLNLVRARAGMPLFGTASYPTAKYPTLELAIEHERRVELALEFHRWFDLKRTNRAIPVLSAKGKAITQDKLLVPVPEIVRQQNPVITQNKGY
ncbi:MAG: RagB/SusD family nutrient uptake outer membrane protein [Segetibacter sp.]|nr:RagB/SusD family nutrient uptake outer membrane protein [Segetibacter sp.]